jgi:hypothetical protein
MSLLSPKRGSIHPVYELNLGGSPLDQDYLADGKVVYASQLCNDKVLASIQQNLMNSSDLTTSVKFDGMLETVGSSTTERGKERFLILLQCHVEEHGQQTFYYFINIHNTVNTVVNLFNEVHNFTLDMVVFKFFCQLDPANQNHDAFGSYKKDELMLSQLVVESFLLTGFFEKILVNYGH